MSYNRLIYDTCSYEHELTESVGPLAYQLDPSRYEHCNKCRFELGLLGGNNVSHIKGNLVDLETELRGQTRLQSKCPGMKYQMPCPKTDDLNNCKYNKVYIRGHGGNKPRVVDTTPLHLPSCQMFRYKPPPLPPAVQHPGCGK